MPRPVSLSLELLQTFITLVRNGGNAADTAQDLHINQPSMSKRLRYLQHAGPVLEHPWLVREGKTWRLTAEGQKVLPAVEEIVRRYEQLSQFIEKPEAALPRVTFACGQRAVAGVVLQAVRLFRRKHPQPRLRISTLRGNARIEGVANGSLDLATVTHDEPAIVEIARRPLHVETIASDRLALVCAEDTPWSGRVQKLPRHKAPPEAFANFPLILPEPDAGIRKGLDRVFREKGLMAELDIALEIGGWSAILGYVREGLGVGVVSEAAIPAGEALVVRHLDPEYFPPIATRLICRRLPGFEDELDLSPEARAFRDALAQAARRKGE
jgi:DNA-binding transcriptional LysR family regulator